MACLGGYFLANQVSVVGSYWSFYGANTFGITLVPMLFGVGILFWNGRSLVGWILTAAGALFILAGVIANIPSGAGVKRRSQLFLTDGVRASIGTVVTEAQQIQSSIVLGDGR